MQLLQDRLMQESKHLGRNVLKVDSFLNHQIDPDLLVALGQELAQRFAAQNPTKVLTVETSGIAPGFTTAYALHVPLVVARKRRAAGLPRELLHESTFSQAQSHSVELYASPEFLTGADRVLIIDDFLTSAQGIIALARLAADGGAQVVGIGVLIEKAFEQGRDALQNLGVPVEALVSIEKIEEGKITFA